MPIDHLLIVNKTYLMILRVKKQREVHELIVEFIDINVTMMAKVQYGKKEGNAKENFKKQNTRFKGLYCYMVKLVYNYKN